MPQSGLPTEGQTLELLGRIQDGDAEAWTDLYRRYHDELLFVVRMNLGRRLRGVLESEDVLQSVALEAFRALDREGDGGFEHRGGGSLRSFLHRLVLNKIRDRADTHGAAKRKGAVPLTDTLLGGLAGDDAPPAYHDRARYERLEHCLNRLPEEMRRVLLLRKVEDLPSRTIAKMMDRSDTAVRKLYSRALARLTLLMSGSEAA